MAKEETEAVDGVDSGFFLGIDTIMFLHLVGQLSGSEPGPPSWGQQHNSLLWAGGAVQSVHHCWGPSVVAETFNRCTPAMRTHRRSICTFA